MAFQIHQLINLTEILKVYGVGFNVSIPIFLANKTKEIELRNQY
jgi:hypothetical protein